MSVVKASVMFRVGFVTPTGLTVPVTVCNRSLKGGSVTEWLTVITYYLRPKRD